MAFNCYCEKCKNTFRSDTEKVKCPECGKKAQVKGIVVNITTSNGEFKKHI